MSLSEKSVSPPEESGESWADVHSHPHLGRPSTPLDFQAGGGHLLPERKVGFWVGFALSQNHFLICGFFSREGLDSADSICYPTEVLSDFQRLEEVAAKGDFLRGVSKAK